VSAAGDGFPRHLVLSVGFALLAISAIAIAAALALDLGLGVVYACAALFTVALGSTPGAVASLLVHHARSPVELMQWNIRQSFMRAGGSLIGPAIQARLPHDDRMTSTVRLRTILTDSFEGIRYVSTLANPNDGRRGD
jgi:MFS family permease